jgi:hypothetical protein
MILIAMCAAMTACAVEDPKAAPTATHEQSLICDPCDPGNFQQLVNAMVGAGSAVGSPVGPPYCHVVHGHDDSGDIVYWNECTNHYQNQFLRYLVDCADLDGEPNCAILECGSPIAPTC